MNNLLNAIRSFIPENPSHAAMAGFEGDMDLDSIKILQRPPLRKNASQYDDEGIRDFQGLCAGTVMLDERHFLQIFEWCVKNNEKNALVWWMEKAQIRHPQKRHLLFEDMTTESFHVLGYALCRSSSIQGLSFFKTKFTAESAKAFGDALKQTRNLTTIYLSDIKLAPPFLMDHLAQGLRHQAGMKALLINCTELSEQNVACLVDALDIHNGMELTLADNDLECHDIERVFRAIKQGNNIHSLHFRERQISEKSMEEIAGCIKAASNLKKFSFYSGGCALGSAAILERALTESSINEMELFFNNSGSAIGVNVSNLIKESRSLSALSLNGGNLNASDFAKISNELIGNRRLQCFSLYNGKFDGGDVLALAAVLQANTNLCELNLAGCMFPPDAGEILCNAIRVNTTLEKINVGGSNLSAEHQTRISNVCTRNREARRLMQQDELLYSRMANPVALPVELGALLANHVLMLSNSAAEYESVTTEIALSIRTLANDTRNGPQRADVHSGETPQKLPEGCTLV